MTSLLERTISIIAPHRCFGCSKEINVLCAACRIELFDEAPEMCFLCNIPTVDSRVCEPCRRQTVVEHVWMAAAYQGIVKQVIRAYKFERVRAAYQPLSQALCDRLPYLPEGTVVAHVPTASVRIRQRGYDQSKLLAQEVARLKGLSHQSLLRRRHDDRQVGSTRSERMKQAARAFELRPGVELRGRSVLIIDDVTTSGATLIAAASILKAAGAECVNAAVVAKHTLE